MATAMTATAPVQCPVCFKDFTPGTINGHLDVCLLNGVTDSSPSAAEEETEPPPKKTRVIPEAAPPPSPGVNNTSSSGMFSLFQANKSKVSGLISSKQPAVNKGIKRGLLSEAEPGPADLQSPNVPQPCASNGQTMKAPHGLNGQTVTVKAPHALTPLLEMKKPLAEILRPNTMQEYFGQSKVVGQQTLFRSLLDSQEIPSLILWGPPGCGKVGAVIPELQHPSTC